MSARKVSAAVVAAAQDAARDERPSEDKLQRIREKIAEARDLDEKIAEVQETLSALEKRLFKIRYETLPGMFEEVGVTTMTLRAEGNHPPCVAKLVTQYNAKLPDDERRDEAMKKFKWLGELAKNTFSVQLGKGDAKQAKTLSSFLRKQKLPFDQKISVHSGTLTAEIRRRFEGGQPLAQADLELLGAFIRPVVKIDKPKEK